MKKHNWNIQDQRNGYTNLTNSKGEVIVLKDMLYPDALKEAKKYGRQYVATKVKAKVQPIKEDAKLSAELPLSGDNVVCVDAWTSGNPGMGGCRITTLDKKVIAEWNSKKPHSNNLFELTAIYLGIKYINQYHNGNGTIYSDSMTALSWTDKGISVKSTAQEKELLEKIIDQIKDNLTDTIAVFKWETELWGENPADYGRK